MAHIDDSLKAALYRITCPDSATLGNFHLSLLPPGDQENIAAHLKSCPYCSLEIEQLERFLAETAVSLQPTTTERIKVWIAKRLPYRWADGQPIGNLGFCDAGRGHRPLDV